MESGQIYQSKIFIDATYEGDLMATAGVSYTVGREANSYYGESLNGVQANNVSLALKKTISMNNFPNLPSLGSKPRLGDFRCNYLQKYVPANSARVTVTSVRKPCGLRRSARAFPQNTPGTPARAATRYLDAGRDGPCRTDHNAIVTLVLTPFMSHATQLNPLIARRAKSYSSLHVSYT